MQVAKWLQITFITSLMNAPAVILMDDVDALIPAVPEHAPPQEQHIIAFVNEFLASVLDWMREKVCMHCLYLHTPFSFDRVRIPIQVLDASAPLFRTWESPVAVECSDRRLPLRGVL